MKREEIEKLLKEYLERGREITKCHPRARGIDVYGSLSFKKKKDSDRPEPAVIETNEVDDEDLGL